MPSCCIVKCSNDLSKNKNYSYHRIPKIISRSCRKTYELSLARRTLWLARINRGKGFDEGKINRAFVCGKHFVQGYPSTLFDNTNVNWAPSLHLGYGDSDRCSKMSQAASKRYERQRRREQTTREKNISASSETSMVKVLTPTPELELVLNLPETRTNLVQSGTFGNELNADAGTENDIVDNHCVCSCACHQSKNHAHIGIQVNEIRLYNDAETQTDDNYKELNPTTSDKNYNKSMMYDSESQTDLIASYITKMEQTINEMQSELCNFKCKVLDLIPFNEQQLTDPKNEPMLKFYTGLPNYKIFKTVFDFVTKNMKEESHRNSLTKCQEFLLVLMRLRMNVPLTDLAFRFKISLSTASRIFYKWIDEMYFRLKPLVRWPERENLWNAMPVSFKLVYGNKIAVIIDCFEIFIERPVSLLARAATWSNYKHHNTIKYLIGISPAGTVIFISEGFGGRCSDKRITEESGLLDHIIPGDAVLADRGFNIAENLGCINAQLIIPAFTRGKNQLELLDTEYSREVSNLRIHVERVIGHLRQKYKILNGPVPTEMLQKDVNGIPHFDKITTIACALTNFCPSIVSQC